MGFTCGIIGLPNVGKSTLFNAITSAGAEASNYPFCSIEPNVGVVPVPDRRLDALGRVYRPQRIVPTTLEFVDIAGLVRGASRGEGLGNQFLARIREVDALAHVVRCFDDENVVHVDGSVDPARDIGVVETELILKDLETVEHRLTEAHHRAKSADKKARAEAEFLERMKRHLAAGKLARSFEATAEDEPAWRCELHLLTGKPLLYVCNIHERDAGKEDRPYVRAVADYAAKEGAPVVSISAEVEAEVAELPEGERKEFLDGLGLPEPGLSKVIRAGYGLLRLLTFFTCNAKEVHAWTVPAGTTALEAAGKVHSDFARGFIRAEVIACADLERLGSEHAVSEAGLTRMEGRDYRVQDGDVLYIRFNV